MGIRTKRLQRRDELYEQFVSVQGLIDYLAAKESLGIGEVAAELEEIFVRNVTGSELPVYGYVDEPSIAFIPYSNEQRASHLPGILSDTIFLAKHSGTADHHGWLRSDLFPFLWKTGMPFSFDLPKWSPLGTLHPQKDDSTISQKPLGQIGLNESSYSTPLLDLQKAAIFEFYSHPRTVDPRKEEVVEWLFEAAKQMDLALSTNVADAMFTIIKPTDHNPKIRRG